MKGFFEGEGLFQVRPEVEKITLNALEVAVSLVVEDEESSFFVTGGMLGSAATETSYS